MKIWLLTFAILLSLSQPAPAQTHAGSSPLADAKPLPSIDFLLRQVISHVVNMEDKNDDLFDLNYQYTHTWSLEYRNTSGELKKREGESVVENEPQRRAAERKKAISATGKDKPEAKTNSASRGNDLKETDYSVSNLTNRLHFTIAGREMLNGRPSLVVEFKPTGSNLPASNFDDKFISKVAGRIWIDEEDYAIAQANVRLTEKINIFGGLVGSIWKFNCSFTRLRTPEGYWFARQMDWHFEGREVLVNRVIDYHESKLNEQKIVAPANTH
jgi:hypothetical protein